MRDKLLERGAKWFKSTLPQAAAVEVEIRAENVSLESLEVIPGRHNFQQYLVEEAAGTDEVFDWIVPEQSLVFPGKGKLEPATGWEIRHRLGDDRVAVFAIRPTSGARAFDIIDQFGLLYRMHSQFVGIES